MEPIDTVKHINQERVREVIEAFTAAYAGMEDEQFGYAMVDRLRRIYDRLETPMLKIEFLAAVAGVLEVTPEMVLMWFKGGV